MNTILKIVLVYIAIISSASAELADIVWAENSAEQHLILISHWDGEDWSEPQIIYQSDNFVAAPAVASQKNGAKLAIWTEQQRRKTILMKSNRSTNSSEWTEGELFSRFGIENVAPAIVVDRLGSIWVFWSAHTGGLSDVYFSKYEAGAWSEPIQVNKKNQVPDVIPIAQINSEGNVEVKWQTYSFDELKYVEDIGTFTVVSVEDNSYKSDSEGELAPKDVRLPSFLPRNITTTLHFPNNRHAQSFRLEQQY